MTYTYVRTREQQPISVYKREGAYLRIGPANLIRQEIQWHETLAESGFPIPQSTESGSFHGQGYYVESSLGAKQFSRLFIEDWKKGRCITSQHFEALVRIVKRVASAQLQNIQTREKTKKRLWKEFFENIHLGILRKELPSLADKLRHAALIVEKRLTHLPFVLSHGDFNAHNIFPRGIIDIEHVLYAPSGYDLVTLIAHGDMFPWDEVYEFRRWYEFSKDQKKKYFSLVDKIYAKKGLPVVSRFLDEFTFCRSIWSAARMKKYPRLQQWRFDIVTRLTHMLLARATSR